MATIIDIKVFPSAGRQQCVLDASGLIKIYLKAAPEKGKANQELIKMLARALQIPTDTIMIVSGQTTQRKKIKIMSAHQPNDVYAALGLPIQQSM